MNIPKDFSSSWPLSDVVLIAKDAEGNERELHAGKQFLATYSSFFESMFFSGFKEGNSDSVKISCSYENMKLILEIIYGFSRDFSYANNDKVIAELMDLYKAADYLDIPAIRKMCIQQMSSRPSAEMAVAVLRIASVSTELKGILMGILEKLKPKNVKYFITHEDSHILFSKGDLKLIYRLIAGTQLPKPMFAFSRFPASKDVPDLSNNFKDLSVDFSQKQPYTDVIIKTKNSFGNKLYSSKAILSMVSSHFSEMFFGAERTEKSLELTEIEINVDYMIMKNILTIIHPSYDYSYIPSAIKRERFLMYSMYCTASRDNLDIHIVRNICVKALKENMDNVNWEMATSMKMEPDERLSLIQKMETKEARSWLFNISHNVPDSSNYFDCTDNGCAVYCTSDEKPVVSLNEARIVIQKLLNEYNK